MRTIDADKLVDMLYDNEFAVLCPLDEVSGVVDACPTVDAVPVVRCRDCRSYNKPRLGYCEVHLDRTFPDNFCSWGEFQTNAALKAFEYNLFNETDGSKR